MSNLSACFPETLGASESVIMVSRQVKRRLDRIIAGEICAALHGLAELSLKMKPFPGTAKKNKKRTVGCSTDLSNLHVKKNRKQPGNFSLPAKV